MTGQATRHTCQLLARTALKSPLGRFPARNTTVRLLSISRKVLSRNPPVLDRSIASHAVQSTGITGNRFEEDATSISCPKKTITLANVEEENRMLATIWEDGEVTQYPYVWLRDNCQCPTCFHEFTNARLLLMRDLNVNIRPSEVQLDRHAQRVMITWSDGHQSPYPFDWLQKRSFKPQYHTKRDLMFRKRPILWGSEIQDKIPTFDFQQLLTDDVTLYELLTRMEEYGVTLIKDAPTEVGQARKVASRVSFMRMTPFGFIYSVKAREDPPNLAWTSDPLGLHADFPYLKYMPGVGMLHCIVQAVGGGGATELVDAFRAAQQMKDEYPFYFKLLCEVPVDFTDVGSDLYPFHYLARHTTFRHGFDGELETVKYSNQTRDSFLRVPLEVVIPFYKALRQLNDLLYRPENKIAFCLDPGDIVLIHNDRVLHGRTGFTMVGGGPPRHLEGCYLDWDDLHSRRRLLMERLGIHKI